jgi:hypothetical protein
MVHLIFFVDHSSYVRLCTRPSIKDLPFVLKSKAKLFADDTIIYETTTNRKDKIDDLIANFINKLQPLLDWFKFNKLYINWDITYAMIVTNNLITKLGLVFKVIITTTLRLLFNNYIILDVKLYSNA